MFKRGQSIPLLTSIMIRPTAIALLLCSIGLAQVRAQTPDSLSGITYEGAIRTTYQEGCEGCGNSGHVSFKEDGRLSFTLPGSDILVSSHFTRKGDRLVIGDSDWSIELKGDSLFFTAYEYRHAYVRIRKE